MKTHMVIETVLVSVGAVLILKDKKIGTYFIAAAIVIFLIADFC